MKAGGSWEDLQMRRLGVTGAENPSTSLWAACMEDNQRVTYTYTVSADVIGLLSV
jgi:hypothetical protein